MVSCFRTGIAARITLLWAVSGAAIAHFPWVVPDTVPEAGVTAQVMFGHGPEDARPLEADRVAELHRLDRDGRVQALALVAEEHWRAAMESGEGALLAGLQTPGYWSRTPEGGQRQSRASLDNVSHCSHSHNSFKALVGGVKALAEAWTAPVGHPLEIMPTPGTTAPLAVRLQLRGQPTEGTLTVTSIGDGAVQEWTVDQAGTTEISLAGKGPWLLHSEHREAYGDPAVCDERVFHATLYINAS
ncbi:DUF4198 domain-containing protein [Algiphilus sp.]|uniref:DUF4198 domain-containing protein n=1 Tax=Algiphilus sp. TaxID=1872431 RepID=UPI003B5196E8